MTRQTSKPLKLSKVAKKLYISTDADIKGTRFPTLKLLCDAEGAELDPWQAGVAKLILSTNSEGKFAFGVGGVGMSLPRQVGKTWLVTRIVCAICVSRPGTTVIWTAHHTRTSDETFDHMRSMAKKRPYARYVARVRAANGQQMVNFSNGSRILFGAREHGFGRGFDAVDVLIFDEAQILQSRTLSDMLPTQNASKDPLYIMLGTPPRPLDPSEAFTTRRRHAWDGDGKKCLWVEFGANATDPVGAKSTWRKANPTYGRRTTPEAIERLTELSDDDFRREALGIWNEATGGPQLAIPDELWNAGTITTLPEQKPDKVAVGIDMTPDRLTLVIGRARWYSDPGTWVIDIPEIRQVVKDGTAWAVEWCKQHWPELSAVAIDRKSPAMTLAEDFKAAHVKLTTTGVNELGAATGRLLDAARTGSLKHPPAELQPILQQSQQNATLRPLGRSGLAAITSKGTGEVVAPLVACSLAMEAAWTSKRRPGRKQRLG